MSVLANLSYTSLKRIKGGVHWEGDGPFHGFMTWRPRLLGLIPFPREYAYCPHAHPTYEDAAQCYLLTRDRAARMTKEASK